MPCCFSDLRRKRRGMKPEEIKIDKSQLPNDLIVRFTAYTAQGHQLIPMRYDNISRKTFLKNQIHFP